MAASTIGARIQQARKIAGLNRKQLGEKLNLPITKINKYEHDLDMPKNELLESMAETLNVSAYWLSTGQNPIIPIINEREPAYTVMQCLAKAIASKVDCRISIYPTDTKEYPIHCIITNGEIYPTQMPTPEQKYADVARRTNAKFVRLLSQRVRCTHHWTEIGQAYSIETDPIDETKPIGTQLQ